MSQGLAPIPTLPSNEPINYDDEDYDAVDGGDVVHICSGLDQSEHPSLRFTARKIQRARGTGRLTSSNHRHYRWERVHDQSKACPQQKDDI